KCGLKTIPYTYRKGYRPEYGQHDKKERPYGSYDQCRCLEKYLQKVAKPFLYGFFYLIGLSVKVHSRHGSQIGRRPSQFVQFLIKFLIAYEVSGFGIAEHGLPFQLVFLLL